MTNEIKQELRENATPFPRNVCIPKSELEKIIKDYPELKETLYENSIVSSSSELMMADENPDEIIERAEAIEKLMYALQEKHTELWNRFIFEEWLTEEEKKEKISYYVNDEPFIRGERLSPGGIYIPKTIINDIIRDYPELKNRIYEYALILEEGTIYPIEILKKISEDVKKNEEYISKLVDWINEIKYEMCVYEAQCQEYENYYENEEGEENE